jgi:hypothetical protein
MLNGFKELSCDGQGYIYYKDQTVEHYSSSLIETEKGKQESKKLVEACKHIENLLLPITGSTVIWCFNWYKNLKSINDARFLFNIQGIYTKDKINIVELRHDSSFYIYCKEKEVKKVFFTEEDLKEIEKIGIYHYFTNKGFTFNPIEKELKEKKLGLCYAEGKNILEYLKPYRTELEKIFNKQKVFYYRLTRLHGDSDKLGPCEICNKKIDSMYYQVELKEYIDHKGQMSLTAEGCKNYFGCKNCLIEYRKKEAINIIIDSVPEYLKN